MLIDELDNLAEVAESLRDSGWVVISSTLRLIAHKPGVSFSISRSWMGREDSKVLLKHMEINTAAGDFDILPNGIEGSPSKMASFAANILPIFKEVVDHLTKIGFDVECTPGFELCAERDDQMGKMTYFNMKVDRDGLPTLRILSTGTGRHLLSGIVNSGQVIAAIDSHLTGHDQA